MKKVKILMIIAIIIALILLIAVVILNKLKKEDTQFYYKNGEIVEISSETELYNEEELENVPEDSQIDYLVENLYYFVVKNCIQNYLDTINIENSDYYEKDESGVYVKAYSDAQINEKIWNLLSANYIQENNITIENTLDYINELEKNVIFMPLEIKVVSTSENIKSLAVYGAMINLSNYKLFENINIIVNLDENNLTYSIVPLNNVNSIDDIEYINKETEIENNGKNSYEYSTILDRDLAKEFINIYQKFSIGVPELIFTKLDEEYRNSNFNTLEDYKNYVQENRIDIYNIEIAKVETKEENDKKTYIVTDTMNKEYVFKGMSLIDFTVEITKE